MTSGISCLILSFFGLLLTAVTGARAEMWTNAAGHAVTAELVSGNACSLVLRTPDGKTLTVPVKSLSPSAQALARRRLGLSQPGSPHTPSDDALRKRLDALRQSGAVTEEEDERTTAALQAQPPSSPTNSPPRSAGTPPNKSTASGS